MNHSILDDPIRARLVEAIAVVDFEFTDLWLRYLAHDGSCEPMDVEAYLAGLATISDLEHDILTEAVNERLEELGCRPAALTRGGCVRCHSCRFHVRSPGPDHEDRRPGQER